MNVKMEGNSITVADATCDDIWLFARILLVLSQTVEAGTNTCTGSATMDGTLTWNVACVEAPKPKAKRKRAVRR